MQSGTAEAIGRLAQQAQLLACLHSLSTQHVFASIPLQQMASIQNVADGLSIPAEKLARQIRFTAASGFLMEPQDGYVQHTALSAQFVTRPLLVDAVTFLGETVMDTAADTNNASRRQSQTSLSDDDSCQRRQRQFQAYQRLRRDSLDTAVSQVLLNFNWASLGDVKVVFANAPSDATARTLSEENHNVSCVVQKSDPCKGKDVRSSMPRSHPQIRMSPRAWGSPQPERDANVYVLYLVDSSLALCNSNIVAEATAELRIHLDILRANTKARLVLISDLVPDPGTADRNVESAARTYDLFLMRMANGGLLDMPRLRELLATIKDDKGEPYSVNYVSFRHGPVTITQVTI